MNKQQCSGEVEIVWVLPFLCYLLVHNILCMELNTQYYFLLFEYSMAYLHINIWCVYIFIAFLQYIFLKAMSSLDRDYLSDPPPFTSIIHS